MTIKELKVQLALGSLSLEDKYKIANTSKSKKVLSYLSKDESWIVRSYVASNINTPVEVLSYLSKDEEWYIGQRALERLNI